MMDSKSLIQTETTLQLAGDFYQIQADIYLLKVKQLKH